jgi:murein DD-endopeptidase MepM/ murein hydrolase activator NlpD
VTDPFQPLPAGERPFLAWPTPNRALFDAPERFFARTRANADYGRPGFTRDCGKRLHRGCDIAPVSVRPESRTVTVLFSDCARGVEYPSAEPAWIPEDDIFAVADGVVLEAVADESVSTYGRHVVLAHVWPRSGEAFRTVYAHLDAVTVSPGVSVVAGQKLGTMGRTSSSADAKNWMAIAPHLHFEAQDDAGRHYNPEAFLRAFILQ